MVEGFFRGDSGLFCVVSIKCGEWLSVFAPVSVLTFRRVCCEESPGTASKDMID